MIIAVDFDNVVYDHDGKWRGGELTRGPVPGAREALAALAEADHKIVINSTRNWSRRHRERIAAWMQANDIPYHEIAIRKPNADVYIDDKALPFETWHQILAALDTRSRFEPCLAVAGVGIRNPSNVGRLLRNAGEFGAQIGYLLDCAEPSGMFKIQWRTAKSFDEVLEACTFCRLETIAFHPCGSSLARALPSRSLLVFGGETDGLSSDILERCAHVIRIPHEQIYSCLTAEAASAIACCRWYEQWGLP